MTIWSHFKDEANLRLYLTPNFIENVNREVFALMGDVPQLAPADTNA